MLCILYADACMYVRIHCCVVSIVVLYVCHNVRTHATVTMYVCHVRMHACMYVCMYVFVQTHKHTHRVCVCDVCDVCVVRVCVFVCVCAHAYKPVEL
jgi:hypothetical protein